MKTVRFAQVVKQCGRPEIHLLLVDPAQDAKLQKAIKSRRVMTVYQSTRGQHADYAEVAFEAGAKRQFLIFPKSLKPFAGGRVVGIKYELMEPGHHPAARSPARPKAKPKAKPKPEPKPKPNPAAPDKVVAFPSHNSSSPDNDEEEDAGDIAEIKDRIRHAMAHLERGRPVAAFNLLKRIVDG